MHRYFFIIILIVSVCSSCRKIIDPKVDATQNALVVKGLITDQPQSYAIKLTMAIPYDNPGNNNVVGAAKVSILDDLGKIYKLTESKPGVYTSDPAKLIGQPGRSYTLHIETLEGSIYESSPQQLLPNDTNINAHAEFTSRDVLVEDAYGEVSKSTINGVDLLFDIKSSSDTLPRFRYYPTITIEYTFTIILSPFLSYVYFGWNTTAPNDLINITEEKYQTASTNIQNHSVCFIPTGYTYPSNYRDSVTNKDSLVYASLFNRIITVNQYRLNNDAYQFYKNVNSLLSAQGKIFDPIAFQLQGNIICKNNPQKLALGFFEVSSLKTSYYFIRTGQKIVHQLQSFSPPSPSGFVGKISGDDPPSSANPPDFWIY